MEWSIGAFAQSCRGETLSQKLYFYSVKYRFICMSLCMSVFHIYQHHGDFWIFWYESCVSLPAMPRKVVLMPVFKPTLNSCTYSTCGWSLIGKHRTPPNSFLSIMHLRWVGSFLGENCIPCGATYQATLVVFLRAYDIIVVVYGPHPRLRHCEEGTPAHKSDNSMVATFFMI